MIELSRFYLSKNVSQQHLFIYQNMAAYMHNGYKLGTYGRQDKNPF